MPLVPHGPPVLLLTGSMGSGKSTVLAECGDRLLSRGIAHAAIHLDTLATVHFPADLTDDPDVRPREHGVMYQNLKALTCWTGVAVFERKHPSRRCLATLDDLAWLTGGTGEQGGLLLEHADLTTLPGCRIRLAYGDDTGVICDRSV